MSVVSIVASTTLQAPDALLPARSQMAFTLGFHIILVPLGVVFPLMMVIANYLGLRRDDPDYMQLARRWSKVAAVTFAVGAVTGTVLSFEMGLLWPGMFERFGDVIGVPFALEGIFFFLEAILISIYLFGWSRMKPWPHFWVGVPIPLAGLGGAFMVVAANSWMNQPAGSRWTAPATSPTSTSGRSSSTTRSSTSSRTCTSRRSCAPGSSWPRPTRWGCCGDGATATTAWASCCRSRIAAIAIPIQMGVGDSTARAIYNDQPIKFAAIELNTTTGPDKPEILLGHLNSDGTVCGRVRHPRARLVPERPLDRDRHRRPGPRLGAAREPPDDRRHNIVHLAWDLMVGIGTAPDRARALVRGSSTGAGATGWPR